MCNALSALESIGSDRNKRLNWIIERMFNKALYKSKARLSVILPKADQVVLNRTTRCRTRMPKTCNVMYFSFLAYTSLIDKVIITESLLRLPDREK